MSRAGLLANALLFQLGWFACVIGAAEGQPLAGVLVVTGIALLALRRSAGPRRHKLLLLAAAAAGLLCDSLLVHFGWLSFDESEGARADLSPAWMVALWVNFACTLHASLRWLLGRPLLAALLGALGGPLSYAAGARLGALSLGGDAITSLVAVAVEWAIALPLLTLLATRVLPPDEGARQPASHAPWPGEARARS